MIELTPIQERVYQKLSDNYSEEPVTVAYKRMIDDLLTLLAEVQDRVFARLDDAELHDNRHRCTHAEANEG